MPDTQPTRPSKPSARPRGEPAESRPSARASVARGVFGDASQPSAKPSHESSVRLKAAAEGAVLVTGICGRLGKLLARELHRRNIRAVVHVGVLHDRRRSDRERHSWNIVAFQKLLEYMAQYEVPKLVVLSGANVYGPQANNPQFLTEDAPLLGAQHFGGMRDLVELDMLAQSFFWKHPTTDTVILRPCHIVGRVRNAASNYLRLDRPVMIMGFDPMMQVVHEKDVTRAIQLALQPGVRGIFNIRGPGEMPLSHLVRKAGGRPRVLPSPLARLALDQLWRLRLSNFPSQELDHLRYVCMVDDTRAREELGYEPVHSIDRALRDLRRVRYLR